MARKFKHTKKRLMEMYRNEKVNCIFLLSSFTLKVVIHLTDGLDAPYAEMKRRVEELRMSGKKMKP